MILARGQATVTGGIHEHQHAGFFPGEEGLDDHGTRGGDGAEGEGLRLVPVLGDEHAFATGKPVLLDDPWCTRKAVEGLAKGSCSSDDDVLSRRYTCGLHGFFGEGLGALKRRMRSHRTETRSLPERVSKAIAQRRLWTDDHEMHVEFIRQRQESRDVCSAHRMVRAEMCRPRVARSGVKFDPFVPRQRHGQRVFTSAGAHQENAALFHAVMS